MLGMPTKKAATSDSTTAMSFRRCLRAGRVVGLGCASGTMDWSDAWGVAFSVAWALSYPPGSSILFLSYLDLWIFNSDGQKLSLLEVRLVVGGIHRPETLNSAVIETSARNGAWR
jgi:hypothetical protein